MNENSEAGYIFGTKIPKPVEDKGILWALPVQVEVKCLPPQVLSYFAISETGPR